MSAIDMIHGLVLGLIATQVAIAEAKIAGKYLPEHVRWIIFFTWLVSMPGILLWTHRWRGLLLILLYVVLLALTTALPFMISQGLLTP